MSTATFAAGCFWGVEAFFRQTEGVINTQVGYTGGHSINPTYEQVCSHTTGHAEAVQIEFDETKITYEKLLSLFWKCHNPTQINRQGPDVGSQYRSAIFYHSDEQYKKALASKEQLQLAKIYATGIATEIVPANIFYKAEEYHQRYFEKHPDLHCHINLNENK